MDTNETDISTTDAGHTPFEESKRRSKSKVITVEFDRPGAKKDVFDVHLREEMKHASSMNVVDKDETILATLLLYEKRNETHSIKTSGIATPTSMGNSQNLADEPTPSRHPGYVWVGNRWALMVDPKMSDAINTWLPQDMSSISPATRPPTGGCKDEFENLPSIVHPLAGYPLDSEDFKPRTAPSGEAYPSSSWFNVPFLQPLPKPPEGPISVTSRPSANEQTGKSPELPAGGSWPSAMPRQGAIPVVAPVCQSFPRGREWGICGKELQFACPRCHLVAFCSKRCWALCSSSHLPGCFDETTQPKEPYFVSQRGVDTDTNEFWGASPAVDLINIRNNEGLGFDGTLRMCLTSDFAVRHFIHSIVKHPLESEASIEVVISERSKVHLARTILILGMLLPQSGDEDLSEEQLVQLAQATIHFLYSHALPTGAYRLATSRVISPLAESVNNTFDVANPSEETATFPLNNSESTVKLHMGFVNFSNVFGRLGAPFNFNQKELLAVRDEDLSHSEDKNRGAELRMDAARYATLERWQRLGFLLPHEYPYEMFEGMNPIFCPPSPHASFPLGATWEPLTEWPKEFLNRPDHIAYNDIYGKLFYYLQDMFIAFHKRARALKLSITICGEDATYLLNSLPTSMSRKGFDRVEISDAYRRFPSMAMAHMNRWLKHELVNPCATAFTLFREDVASVAIAETRKEYFRRVIGKEDFQIAVTSDELAKKRLMTVCHLKEIVSLDWGLRLEDSVVSWPYFTFRQNEYIASSDFFGMRRRARHKVINQPWPWRPKWTEGGKVSLEALRDWTNQTVIEMQCWLEWRKVRYPTTEELAMLEGVTRFAEDIRRASGKGPEVTKGEISLLTKYSAMCSAKDDAENDGLKSKKASSKADHTVQSQIEETMMGYYTALVNYADNPNNQGDRGAIGQGGIADLAMTVVLEVIAGTEKD